MVLTLIRRWYTPQSTIGELTVNDNDTVQCYTLEDAVRDNKVEGQTAIPSGRYEVIVNFSQRFQRQMPLLLNVPGFEGIRIHPGNTNADTEGCILVGKQRSSDAIGQSREAFVDLFTKINSVPKGERVWLTILNRSAV